MARAAAIQAASSSRKQSATEVEITIADLLVMDSCRLVIDPRERFNISKATATIFQFLLVQPTAVRNLAEHHTRAQSRPSCSDISPIQLRRKAWTAWQNNTKSCVPILTNNTKHQRDCQTQHDSRIIVSYLRSMTTDIVTIGWRR